MKKLFITLLLFVFISDSFSQVVTPDTTKKEYKNVIGIDGTSILHQIFNNNLAPNFNSPYMVTYRRILKSNAIRICAGGNTSGGDNTSNDSLHTKNESMNLNLGLGFEHYSYLGKRWNFYLGADLLARYRELHSQFSSTLNSGMQTLTKHGYGISPLIGLQFRINSRLSLSTEASYDIVYSTVISSSTWNNAFPYNTKSKRSEMNTQFNGPATINFRIQF